MPVPHLQLQVTAAISHNLKNLPFRYNSLFLHHIKSLPTSQASIMFEISTPLAARAILLTSSTAERL